MRGIPRSIVAVATVIVLTGAVFYFYAERLWYDFFPVAEAPVLPLTPAAPTRQPHEVSAEVTYDVPEASIEHHVRFTLLLDANEAITGVRMVELPKEESSEKQTEFANNLTVMIQGKKLAELHQVDKVGKSTLTTDAFNSVIDELKAGR